ncbi:MAG: hypothetical protein EOO11_05620 [Chitinophagaceae bacterium]|nr:MAG: hypothetical protein EOO11_05620 [Chitinophagaceae bacterium]
MKAALLFLLHLSVLLVGGSGRVHAAGSSATASVNRLLQVAAHSEPAFGEAFVAGTPRATEEWSRALFGIDEEEEEEWGTKLLLLARCLVAFSFAFLLHRSIDSGTRFHSFYKHFSFSGTDRYLALRVLRL